MTVTRLIARPMLASMFVVGGVNALKNASTLGPAAQPVADKVVPLAQKAVPQAPIPTDATTLVRINAIAQITAAAALATGARRVNIGTAALEDPEWCDRIISQYGDRIAIGLDVRGRTLAARGWTKEGGDLYEVLERLEQAGCERYVVTDVASDGMLSGPNVDLLREVCSRTSSPVVASGGISSLTDIADLAALVEEGVEGAIIGTALYVGNFTLTEALELTRISSKEGHPA